MSARVPPPPDGPFIGIDWGSTNARAMLFDAGGTLREEREAPLGAKNVAAGEYRAAFHQLTSRWRAQHGPVPALLSGMVGSRHGWLEVPFLDCPATLPQLPRALRAVPGVDNVWIVPGLAVTQPQRDVMRGEELQLLGIGAAARQFDWVCIPGTHSKWIRAGWPEVREFQTAMTGEVFAAIAEHTLFAKIIPTGKAAGPAFDERAFLDGVTRSAADHGLLAELFGVRADFLLAGTPASSVADRISGLLIGSEIRHMFSVVTGKPQVALLASPSTEPRYVCALRFLGIEVTPLEVKQTTARGFAALMQHWRQQA